ncbi:hypothetical protein A0J61_11190 [Choanephora cucurbitarum]|uniref:Cyanovirin-N domain-containing protein n=1 Tax=Choanephora cucurbitarum TaxID=101091 RepID=A0A1C7MV97_9FUNG|nr:hypothetical protein A0J61_11190 [Choanephora cucurbitarum]
MMFLTLFILNAMAFLSVVSADDVWSLTYHCFDKEEVVLVHTNEFGAQSIIWNRRNLNGRNELCTSNQVVCMKDVAVHMKSCDEVNFDLKVQYAGKWSTNNNPVFHGVRSGPSQEYKVYEFIPEFLP